MKSLKNAHLLPESLTDTSEAHIGELKSAAVPSLKQMPQKILADSEHLLTTQDKLCAVSATLKFDRQGLDYIAKEQRDLFHRPPAADEQHLRRDTLRLVSLAHRKLSREDALWRTRVHYGTDHL